MIPAAAAVIGFAVPVVKVQVQHHVDFSRYEPDLNINYLT
jgi:hypothetical protein